MRSIETPFFTAPPGDCSGRRPARPGPSLRWLTALLAGLLVLSATTAALAIAPDCIEYGQFIHRVTSTLLPGTPPVITAQSYPCDVKVVPHPFAAGHKVAFCRTHDTTGDPNVSLGYLSAIDVTDPTQLAEPVADADLLGQFSPAGSPSDMVLDPDFPARPYIYFCTTDNYLQVVEVLDPDPADPNNIDLAFSEVWSYPGVFDGAAIDIQVRGSQVLVYVAVLNYDSLVKTPAPC